MLINSGRRKKLWEAVPDTGDDEILIGRAAWLARDYSLLRLRLARFAWCAEGVEPRVRVVLRDWGRRVFALFAEDARALDVPLERYVRNLLPVVPDWTVPLLIVLSRRDRKIARMLDGLRLGDRQFPAHKARLADFDRLYQARTPLHPDAVARLVPLRKAARARAEARWTARGLPAPAASAVSPAAKMPVKSVRAETPTPAPKKRSRQETTLERAITRGRQGEAIASDDIQALARWVRRANPRLRKAIGKIVGNLPIPAHPIADLLAALPRRPRAPAIQALRLYAAGHAGAAAEFAGMSRKRARASLRHVQTVLDVSLELDLAKAAVEAWGTSLPRGGIAAAFDRVAETTHDGEQLAKLLTHAAIRRDPWRKAVADRIAALDKRHGDGFAKFIEAAARLEIDWARLPVEIREAALAAWRPVTQRKPDLCMRAARILPPLALEAARWLEDDAALVALIGGTSPGPALSLLARRDAMARDRIWVRLWSCLHGRADLPAPWLAAARKDRRVLDLLIHKALPRLARSSLDGLPLAPLMDASLRNRGLARHLAAAHDTKALAVRMPALRRRLAGKTLRLAAAELALHLGWEHAVALGFLATRPFAPKERPGTRFDGLYRSWDIPKRNGGVRRITAPAPLLKQIQRRLLDAVLAQAPCHPAATGFRPGISIADNARAHVGRKVVVNVDIQGFFPNTRFKLVARAVAHALPRRLSGEAQRLAIDICSMGGGLPTGAPTSPVVANLVMEPADRTLAAVAARHGVAYTRYADDLTLSGDAPQRLLPFLRQVVGELGYGLDPKKTNIFRRGRRQIVTGLVVNDKVSVPRRLRRQLRAAVHRVAHHGAGAQLSLHGRPMHLGELAGHVAFIGVAHPEESRALARQLRAGRAIGRGTPETDTP
jgi:retron-type reverse transcriptase